MHPGAKILCLLALSIAVQMMGPYALFSTWAILILLLMWRGRGTMISMLRRVRWLMLSILFIYAYATPGEYIRGLPDELAPTYEGLVSGAMQAARLAAILGALSVVLASSSREQLMAGIHALLRPLRPFGVAADQFSARLWLTLHYVETMPSGVVGRLRQHDWSLEYLIQEGGEMPGGIQLPHSSFKMHDALILLLWLPLFWMLA